MYGKKCTIKDQHLISKEELESNMRGTCTAGNLVVRRYSPEIL